MKFSILATVTAILGSASAQHAVVINNCASNIYVQSVPYDGSKSGPLTTVAPGKQFSENLRSSGSTVKIGTQKTLLRPLQFGYSLESSPNNAYYELSTQFGNPFGNKHNILSPGEGCKKFDCKAGDKNCYSTPGMKKVYGCPRPVDLTAQICA